MLQASMLPDRSVIALKGPDTREFLQGLVTNDVEQLRADHALYAALLTPQGKILFDFFLADAAERILLDCASARASELLKRLSMYRLRAKVEIAAAPDLGVAAIWGGDNPPAGIVSFTDPRLPALGRRTIAERAALEESVAEIAKGDYAAQRLALGVPDSADLPPDSVLPLDAGFEELHGVSFKKGCYVGQEVTARMKHRATARKRFVVAEFAGPVPAPGTPLEAQDRELGTLASGTGHLALALVRLDRLAEAQEANAPISAAGQTPTLRKPDWLHV